MKRKKIITTLAIVLYALAAGASVDGEALGWIIGIGVLLLLGGILYGAVEEGEKQERKQKAEEERARKKKEKAEQLEQMQEEYQTRMVDIEREYGQPVQLISWGDSWDKDCNISRQFMVFDSTKKLLIMEELYNFSDLIDVQLADNATTHTQTTGTSQGKTKTDTGSMVGRAIVGDVIAGPAGAVIGGTTAKKNTTTTTTSSSKTTTKHDYTVLLTMNSLKNPIIRINVGDDEQAANDIVAIANVIIRNNG